MSSADRGRDQPRAMIHRRILDVAASDPDASMEAIADEVSGASPALVERVLDEYGDPGREDEPGEGHGDAIGSPDADGTAGKVIADGASEDTSDLDDSGADANDGDTTDDTATDDTGPVDTEPTDDTESTADGDDATVGDTAADGATTDGDTTTDGGTTGLSVATSVDDTPVAGGAASADETASATDTGNADDSSTGDDPSVIDGASTTDETAPATTDDTTTATTDDTVPTNTDDTAPGSTTERDDDTLIRGGVDSEGLAAEDESTASDDGAETEDDPDLPPEIDSLSDKQRRTLRALYERPNASQGDLAEELDVTRATVCRRLNAIPGFEWSDRRAFAESVFGGDADAAGDGGATAIRSAAPENDSGSGRGDDGSDTESTDSGDADGDAESARSAARSDSRSGGSESAASGEADASPGITDRRLAAVEDRLAMIESRLDETGAEEGTGLSLSPELAHKVVHACMESDTVTEDEELEVLRALME